MNPTMKRYDEGAVRRGRNIFLIRAAVLALLLTTWLTFPYWGAPQ